jgi:hypothetical protein
MHGLLAFDRLPPESHVAAAFASGLGDGQVLFQPSFDKSSIAVSMRGEQMKLIRTAVPIAFLFLILTQGTAMARYDAAGNIIGDGDGGPVNGVGDVCGTCPAPNDDLGVDFKGNDLLVYDGVIHRYQNCVEAETVTLHPAPSFGFDIGYDSVRNLYLVTDPGAHTVITYASDGSQVGTFAALGNPVGVAYDASRDVYWACDWTADQIYAIDADTGAIGPVFPAPLGTRIAGTGYDAVNDAIAYNARDQAMGHWMSASNGSLIASYAIPLGGKNNGAGCGVDPLTTNVWTSHYEQPFVYCIFGLGPIAVEADSWGSIKAGYR